MCKHAIHSGTIRRAYFWGYFFIILVRFFVFPRNILDGFRAISSGFPKKTFIPFFLLKRTKRRKEGRKEESKETRKEEGRKQGSRNEGRKERRRERRKEGNKETRKKEGRKGSREARKQGSKEGGSKEEREATTT